MPGKGYTEEIVSIAKRENNAKRLYLVVNRLQGKHVPVEPCASMEMFHALAKKVKEAYKGQPLLAIGFAETATAIGAAIAAELDLPYIQTTRESIPGVGYLYFSESHSHATEQKLVKDDLDLLAGKVSRIVFIEDEVTTGNTILNIIRLLRENYGNHIRFSVASILNGMGQEAQKEYQKHQIDTLYLVKTDHRGYSEIAGQSPGDGIYHKKDLRQPFSEAQEGSDEAASQEPEGKPFCEGLPKRKTGKLLLQEIRIPGAKNARRLVQGAVYQAACQSLWERVQEAVPLEGIQDILVLGTEEFMYPPLFVAQKLQLAGHKVKFHATTRSPIAVSLESGYPLHERYELASMYEESRPTYVYDLEQHALVLIITDAPSSNGRGKEDAWDGGSRAPEISCQGNPGLLSLQNALLFCGNQNIYCIRWYES